MEKVYVIAALHEDGTECYFRKAYTKQEYVMEALQKLRKEQKEGDKTVYYYCEFEVAK